MNIPVKVPICKILEPEEIIQEGDKRSSSNREQSIINLSDAKGVGLSAACAKRALGDTYVYRQIDTKTIQLPIPEGFEVLSFGEKCQRGDYLLEYRVVMGNADNLNAFSHLSCWTAYSDVPRIYNEQLALFAIIIRKIQEKKTKEEISQEEAEKNYLRALRSYNSRFAMKNRRNVSLWTCPEDSADLYYYEL